MILTTLSALLQDSYLSSIDSQVALKVIASPDSMLTLAQAETLFHSKAKLEFWPIEINNIEYLLGTLNGMLLFGNDDIIYIDSKGEVPEADRDPINGHMLYIVKDLKSAVALSRKGKGSGKTAQKAPAKRQKKTVDAPKPNVNKEAEAPASKAAEPKAEAKPSPVTDNAIPAEEPVQNVEDKPAADERPSAAIAFDAMPAPVGGMLADAEDPFRMGVTPVKHRKNKADKFQKLLDSIDKDLVPHAEEIKAAVTESLAAVSYEMFLRFKISDTDLATRIYEKTKDKFDELKAAL